MKIARVFPRRTKATPIDSLSFVGDPGLFPPEVDMVNISVTFSQDIPEAERLERSWKNIAPVSIGGPGVGMIGEEFIPGMYLKIGYVITSRGCPNHCWFCNVWKRDGKTREFKIKDGFNVLDDNILSCSDSHIISVFDMLRKQKNRIQFTGGIEAARLKDWHIDLLLSIKLGQLFLAYDTPDDWEPLVAASKRLRDAGFTRNHIRCYVLIGYDGDTIDKANVRLRKTLKLGVFPMAMLYDDGKKNKDKQWSKLQRIWDRPAIISQIEKNEE